jgi:hypothetical protein
MGGHDADDDPQQLEPRLNRLEGGARRWWARAMSPLWQYSLRASQEPPPGRLCCATRPRVNPRNLRLHRQTQFRPCLQRSAQAVGLRPRPERPLRATTYGPTGSRRPPARCRRPLKAPAGQAEESITAPKGMRPQTPSAFPCTTAISGLAGRGHDRRLWPPPSGRRGGGRGRCPVVAVLLAMRRSARLGKPSKPCLSTACLRRSRREPSSVQPVPPRFSLNHAVCGGSMRH